MATPLSGSRRYRSFIQDRDRALEKIHQNTQARLTDILGGTLQRTLEIISYWYGHGLQSVYALGQIERQISQPFQDAHGPMLKAIQEMRKRVYLLSHAGEVEAISRATGKAHRVFIHNLASQADKVSPAGGEMSHRITLYLDRLRHELADALKVAAISGDELSDALDKVRRAFPKLKYYSRPRYILKKPILEKDYSIGKRSQPTALSVGFIDDNEWSDMVSDYVSDYIFTNRGPDGVLEGTEDKIPQYQWELEQDVTQDFVQQVRDGQVAGAKENGINDFVWIAIVDDRTDECCIWRNGLTTKEIQLALQGDHSDDECDTDVPPAHFNCRCTLAPMTEDMPETTPPDFGSFDDWLNETVS